MEDCMTPETEALARRAVACAAWRWMPGMVDQCGWRVLRVASLRDTECVIAAHDDEDVFQWWRNSTGWHCSRTEDGAPEVGLTRYQPPPLWLPDLADPATLGCLLALVREAWGDQRLRVEGYPDCWRCVWWEGSRIVGLGPSEAAALVAALEAAPVRR